MSSQALWDRTAVRVGVLTPVTLLVAQGVLARPLPAARLHTNICY